MKTTTIKIEVLQLNEIKSKIIVHQMLGLDLKVEVNRQQVADIILKALDDFTIEELNEILKRAGFVLIEK